MEFWLKCIAVLVLLGVDRVLWLGNGVLYRGDPPTGMDVFNWMIGIAAFVALNGYSVYLLSQQWLFPSDDE